MSLSSPGVHLFHHSHWQDACMLDELCWGLEEQGVLCRSVRCDEHGYALASSKLAARSSTLCVGLSPNAAGDIALTHAQLPEDRALICGYIRTGITQIQILGTNADQSVKVFPSSKIR